jgi:hypothetical protein
MIRIEINADALTAKLRMAQAELQDVVRRANQEIAAEMKRDFESTTATWNHQVTFGQTTHADPEFAQVAVGTNDLIYKFVDEGTRAHGISPKRPGGRLRFQWGGPGSYTAKTTPGSLVSGPGGPSGPEVLRYGVWHPGTQGRQFTFMLQRKWDTEAGVVYRRYVAAWIRSVRG